MCKKVNMVIILTFIALTLIDVKVYAAGNFSETINALYQIPYLTQVIEEFFVYNNAFSLLLFVLVKGLVEFILGITIVAVFKNFVAQGSIMLCVETSKVLLTGVLAYVIIVMILVIFFASFIGFPVGVLILVITYITIVVGKVLLQVHIGHFLEVRLNRTWHIYLNYLVGMLLVEIVVLIPFIGKVLSYFVIPVISVGMLVMTIANKYIYKRYFPVELNQTLPQKIILDRQEIRKIVMRGIDRNDRLKNL